ncbi:2-heptaprenyl-1,4-naphthoquinone methyltransferase MenG [Rhodococcus wratislaviensis]|uniref:Demethylmenaquinone methyltransferase n=1 Tax=Rhodococcus wratislaviensis TaxID=44752 RepID=A0A402CKZ1_RHOWR|nr:ubiquinone/menaquinone biosynthesis methyltransferase [Rhodococcus wratislaviensis]GCE44264.1 2-heptaprenyl-1,4-naphthoquinone methyltransferase MenG [Rhodococcus wratislaviensis]
MYTSEVESAELVRMDKPAPRDWAQMDKSGVKETFDSIADYYDHMNRVMTMGRHRHWCKEVARRAVVPLGGSLLDIATGTGEIALAARCLYPHAAITAADFSESMLAAAAARASADRISWQVADANSLPFADESFDSVTSGYLLRNVDDVYRVLAEQFRVLKPGGNLVVLETCPPTGPLSPLVTLGVRLAIPMLGQAIAHDRESYKYLRDSTLAFIPPEKVAGIARRAGFQNVRWRRKFLGTNMILWARRPA